MLTVRKSIHQPQKYLKIPENLTHQAASVSVPKSVLNDTRVIKVTQTTKKYERDTIIENQPSFRCNSNFSDISVFLPHRWTINGPSMGRPWKSFFVPCMGVHGISVRAITFCTRTLTNCIYLSPCFLDVIQFSVQIFRLSF